MYTQKMKRGEITDKVIKIVQKTQKHLRERLRRCFDVAEMVGFEPTPRLPGLPHFECGPLNLLGTSPSLHGFGTLLKGA